MAMDAKAGEGLGGLGSLPHDHEEQLQLGHRIIQGAFHGHKSKLENEVRVLTTQVTEFKEKMSALQKKNSSLEVELVESHQRSQQLAEENKELFKTVGNLRKQIGRLEHLKAAVMSSIQDDHEKEVEMGETRALMTDTHLHSSVPLTAHAMGAAPMGGSYQPMMSSMYTHGLGLAAEPRELMTSQGLASPAPATPAPIDGKAFFRQARGRLSHEAFNQFLASIKRLNNQQQTREDTLNDARTLFGPEHNDLYVNFENLLNSQAGL
jgi:regulator of replication initiation timing